MRSRDGRLNLASGVRASNVWLLRDGEGRRFLVDTGHPLERPVLRWTLWRWGLRRPGDLEAVLLTHRHSDHAGNAAWLRRRFQCPVYCHPADAPFLSGERPPPRLSGRGARWTRDLLCRVEDRFPARCPVDGVYEEGDWRWGFRVEGAPGHTEGSVILHHGPSSTLFSGDVILTGPPVIRFVERLDLAKPEFSLDADRCHAAVRRFLDRLPPTRVVCAGHGPLVDRRAQEKLRGL